MDPRGNIYNVEDTRERDKRDKAALAQIQREDEARLDGYLKARAEADKERHRAFLEEEAKKFDEVRGPDR